jgi:hypothetical protein
MVVAISAAVFMSAFDAYASKNCHCKDSSCDCSCDCKMLSCGSLHQPLFIAELKVLPLGISLIGRLESNLIFTYTQETPKDIFQPPRFA